MTAPSFLRGITALMLGIGVLAVPVAAEAGSGRKALRKVDRIEQRVDNLYDIRNPGRRLYEADRLQRRLSRLERRVEDRGGRRARIADRRIDALQYEVGRIERRTERRIARRYEPRRFHRRQNVVIVRPRYRDDD
ncbi:MAG: hypothetical protein AAF713_19900 [Pseudomonadota bacterium]